MKITGLKVLQLKEWKADDVFTADTGKQYPIPANHKVVLIDENSDIVNATIQTPQPLALQSGKSIDVILVGNCSKNQFGWQIKCKLA